MIVMEAPARRTTATLPKTIAEKLMARRVTLTVQPDEDGYWTLLRYLDSRGGFTIGDATRPLNDDMRRADITTYIGVLMKAGYVAAHKAGGELLRIVKKQPEAPRLTAAGRPRSKPHRELSMWLSMQTLGYFTIRDLILTASADKPLSFDVVERYVEALLSAGYLLRQDKDGRTQYRLRPKMWTGPAAPRVLNARLVFDPNLGCVMGQPTIVESRA